MTLWIIVLIKDYHKRVWEVMNRHWDYLYLKDECNITNTGDVKEQTIKDYLTNIKERGKYTVVADDNSKKFNNPQNRQDFGKKVSLATVNNYTRNLRVYFNYMYDNRLIKLNPMKNIKTIKTPRKVVGYMADKDFNNLLECFDLSKFHEDRDYVITQLIFDTGMRLGECLAIRDATDIDFQNRTIFLPAENAKEKRTDMYFFQ